MADIELVIKIPKEIRLALINNVPMSTDQWSICDAYIMHAIINGTPLPKGHGRLIDADELYEDFIDGTEGYDCQTWNRIEISDIIEDAPTIIGADKEDN